ncbi:MAG: hypothetical protein HUK19_00500 [Fibrobacter sp.]|nr:hypothetical protein [Fibrobacter sp.]
MLALVLGIVLAVTCMLTVLLQIPGGVRRAVVRNEIRLQKIYDEESAILAELNGFPDGYFEQHAWGWNLPKVQREMQGLWMTVSSEHVSALAGILVEDTSLIPLGQKRLISDRFRTILKNEILQAENLKTEFGNRRLFGTVSGDVLGAVSGDNFRTVSGDASGGTTVDAFKKSRNLSLQVLDGDLYMDLSGSAACGNFYSSGSLTLKGSATFDTLRLYSLGPLRISGAVSVRHLEAYSGDALELPRNFKFMGLAAGASAFVVGSNMLSAFAEGKLVPFQWVYQ